MQNTTETTVGTICRREFPAIQWDATIRTSVARMKEYGTRCLTVSADGEVIGLISDWDILAKAVLQGLDADRTPVEAVMRVGLPSCPPDASLADSAKLMKRKRVPQLAVVEKARRPQLIGVVTAEDLLEALGPSALGSDFLLAVFT